MNPKEQGRNAYPNKECPYPAGLVSGVYFSKDRQFWWDGWLEIYVERKLNHILNDPKNVEIFEKHKECCGS